MTKEEKLAVLEAAEVRAYRAIESAEGPDMGMEWFAGLLHSIEQLSWNQERLTDPGREAYFEGSCGCGAKTESGSEPGEEAQETETADTTTDGTDKPHAPEQQPEAESGNEGPEPPTRDQVRSKLAKYQTTANLDVAALMKRMGYSKLSEVPVDRYWELLELAQNTADGEG